MADRSLRKSIAIIPARSGSKRIPRKNIQNFFGKPMLAHSIEHAKALGTFDRILVSTDSEEIAQIAKKYGAEVPFLRPQHLSDDFTPLADVLLQVLDQAETYFNESYESLCCILATAPFIQITDLKRAKQLLDESSASAVVPVTSFPYPIFRALKVEDNGNFSMFWPEHELTRSNDLPEGFHDVGQFYWLNAEKFRKSKRIFAPDARVIRIPRHLAQDIDTPEDWQRAEMLYQGLHPELLAASSFQPESKKNKKSEKADDILT